MWCRRNRGRLSLTASIGAVSAPRYARSAEEAMVRAQEALECAKARRRGSFWAWKPDVERDAQRRVNIRVTDEIVNALNERRVVLAYEPVVDVGSRATAFHECLVRLKQENGELLLAPDVVPTAERLGLIHLVDQRGARARHCRAGGRAARRAQPQHLARHHHGSRLVDANRSLVAGRIPGLPIA